MPTDEQDRIKGALFRANASISNAKEVIEFRRQAIQEMNENREKRIQEAYGRYMKERNKR